MKVSRCALIGAAAGIVHGIPIMKRALNDGMFSNSTENLPY